MRIPWLQVERIWGIVNVHAQDIHTSLGQAMKDKIKPPRLQWKVSLALLFSSWKKDVKKLKKLYQELDEFVTVKEEKRCVVTQLLLISLVSLTTLQGLVHGTLRGREGGEDNACHL